MAQKIATVFGGSGFLGRYIVSELLKEGYAVKIVSRTPERAKQVCTSGTVGQVTFMQGNLRSDASVKKCVKGSDLVINSVGILFEYGKQKFPAIHGQGAERIAKACKAYGVKRLIHISALGVDRATKSFYARTKIHGEKAVMAAFPAANILRPSIIFGPEDGFFNMFARMAMVFPYFMPLIGGGKTRFQPVYVVDVAKAVIKIINTPQTQGKSYELGGPRAYSFRQLIEFILYTTERKKILFPIPFAVAKVEATFLELLPHPLLTRDQVTLLKTDNIVRDKENGFISLGIEPKCIEEIVPSYLAKYKKNS